MRFLFEEYDILKGVKGEVLGVRCEVQSVHLTLHT